MWLYVIVGFCAFLNSLELLLVTSTQIIAVTQEYQAMEGNNTVGGMATHPTSDANTLDLRNMGNTIDVDKIVAKKSWHNNQGNNK